MINIKSNINSLLTISATSIICERELVSLKSNDMLYLFNLTQEELGIVFQSERIKSFVSNMLTNTFDSSNDYHLVVAT